MNGLQEMSYTINSINVDTDTQVVLADRPRKEPRYGSINAISLIRKTKRYRDALYIR